MDWYVARDGGYIPFELVSDGVDARSDERERKTPAARNYDPLPAGPPWAPRGSGMRVPGSGMAGPGLRHWD